MFSTHGTKAGQLVDDSTTRDINSIFNDPGQRRAGATTVEYPGIIITSN